MSKLESAATAKGALGVFLDPSGTAVVVMPSAHAADFTAADAAALGVPVRTQLADIAVETVKNMKDDLDSFRAALSPAFGYAFYFDLHTARMIVQTNAPASAFSAIAAKYPGHLDIQAGATGGLTGNRQNDTPAFWGGSAIYTPLPCSSGFMAKGQTGTATYLSTAGHCGAVGATVTTAGSLVVGRITGREWPTYEIEWINGGLYQAVIYNGGKGDDTSHISVYGLKWAVVGQPGYCRTGSVSGSKCDWTVGSTDASYCTAEYGFPLKCTDYVNAFSGTVPDRGDSGGPVYYRYNGGALINGSIIGFWCTPLGCTSYGEKAGSALGRWKLDLVCIGTCTIQ